MTNLRETDKRFRDPPFTAAECDGCGDTIETKAEEKACPKCSGYFHKGECYRNHVEKEHRA